MAKGERSYAVGRLLLIGLVFHIVFILSVFDCYFTSPVVHGMQSYKASQPLAKRLVLIVGDGLRADLLFQKNGFPDSLFTNTEKPEIVAPYIRSIIENRGAFGVSHTRVPTESRPGHVSIIGSRLLPLTVHLLKFLLGGMYEDVSAVTKGWKTNPVDFDSIFNQSSATFSFGSPDILPMFAKGATQGKVHTWMYNEEDEDFTKDATALDIWVLNQLRELLTNSTTDPPLRDQLNAQGTVFFLHLLGLDTTGHSYRPFSIEYMRNIQIVDDVVRETEQLLSEFYGDAETSFIFTADHGMSVIGNHGDGHPDNTRTPLVAWGKGIRGPLPDVVTASSHDLYSSSWELDHLFRRDVEQADIATLMASLLGISWPVHSVGVLPDVDPALPGFLSPSDGRDWVQADTSLTNVLMLLESYRVQHELKERHTFFYKPFEPLERITSQGITQKEEYVSLIRQFMAAGLWNDARSLSKEVILTALQGLRYVQTYERKLIGMMATLAYLGWCAYSSLYVFRPVPPPNTPAMYTHLPTCLALLIMLSFWMMSVVQASPWTYYLYIFFPCYFWREFFVQALPCVSVTSIKASAKEWIIRSVLVIAALQGMVGGYTHRSLWAVGFVLMATIWPLNSWTKAARAEMGIYAWIWPLSCFASAIFPLLSVDKTESLITILSGGVGILVLSLAYYVFAVFPKLPLESQRSMSALLAVQAVLLAFSMVVTTSSVWSLQSKLGLPFINQMAGWLVLVISLLIPFLWPLRHESPDSQLLVFYLGLGVTFVILSISVEGLFYSSFTVLLTSWIAVEQAVRRTTATHISQKKKGTRGLSADDLRVALFFLFFVQVGFFGTGNVASISSFYLAPVYRLIPVFNPFFMASLLLFKIIVPYIILSVMFATLNHRLELEPFSLFLVALAVMDGMTLTFFFKVTDTGSWLEIGQSISFFCITSLLLLWSAGICVAGEYLMSHAFSQKLKMS